MLDGCPLLSLGSRESLLLTVTLHQQTGQVGIVPLTCMPEIAESCIRQLGVRLDTGEKVEVKEGSNFIPALQISYDILFSPWTDASLAFPRE